MFYTSMCKNVHTHEKDFGKIHVIFYLSTPADKLTINKEIKKK